MTCTFAPTGSKSTFVGNGLLPPLPIDVPQFMGLTSHYRRFIPELPCSGKIHSCLSGSTTLGLVHILRMTILLTDWSPNRTNSDGVLFYLSRGIGLFQTTLMAKHHSGKFAKNFTERKLYATISRQYWWKGMRADIRVHRFRLICASRKGTGKKTWPPHKSIPVGGPLESVCYSFHSLTVAISMRLYSKTT